MAIVSGARKAEHQRRRTEAAAALGLARALSGEARHDAAQQGRDEVTPRTAQAANERTRAARRPQKGVRRGRPSGHAENAGAKPDDSKLDAYDDRAEDEEDADCADDVVRNPSDEETLEAIAATIASLLPPQAAGGV
jgi:hypothetical protein